MSRCAAVGTHVNMHAFTAVVEDYPIMLCRLKLAFLSQNTFGHPEIRKGYT